MILFHPLQNRAFQFSLSLLAMLEGCPKISRRDVETLAEQFLLTPEYLDEVLTSLSQAGFISLQTQKNSWIGCTYNRTDNNGSPIPYMPMGTIEWEYLQYILRLPEAELFLPKETREILLGEEPLWLQAIQRLYPKGNTDPSPDPANFRVILEAIRTGRYICYEYRTRDNTEYIKACYIPWKLEYSAYDHRWWIILYDEEENRTIKSVLSHLKQVSLGSVHHVTQDEILETMEQLKESEPVVLRVNNARLTLERCFLQFETQELQSKCIDKEQELYEVTFTYYRFDKGEILRKLMQLGPAVTLIGPYSLKQELRQLLQRALEQTKEKEHYEEFIR